MRRAIRFFILGEGASFIAAALVHFGVLLHGYEHRAAGTAETVIGSVLLIGLGSTGVFPRFTRGIGIGVQGFALLGTFVGIFTIIVGMGHAPYPISRITSSLSSRSSRVSSWRFAHAPTSHGSRLKSRGYPQL